MHFHPELDYVPLLFDLFNSLVQCFLGTASAFLKKNGKPTLGCEILLFDERRQLFGNVFTTKTNLLAFCYAMDIFRRRFFIAGIISLVCRIHA